MIPRITGRGHSFKGAGLYYLHDKEAKTTDRVAWTQTRNIPVNDPQAATNWMAYTAMSADNIKRQADIPLTGRKREKGVVYTFSLSWSPEENPDRQRMEQSADETLELLGLKDHQSLLVAHNDTKHPHVHIICNLINPNDGRMHDPDWGSQLKLSDWSLKHEQENGQVLCEQRLENHQERKKGRRVRYQEPVHDRKAEIQELYRQSDSGASFKAALNENGYTLAKGNRRRFVLVDNEGKIHSLSRQLDKEQRKGHLDKLSDLKHQDLQMAQKVVEERQYFDRDKYAAAQEQKLIDAAIEAEQRKQEDAKRPRRDFEKTKGKNNEKAVKKAIEPDMIDLAHQQSKEADKKIAWGREAQRQRLRKQKELNDFYQRQEHTQKIKELKQQIASNDNTLGKISGRFQRLQNELDAEQKTLEHIDQRMKEQMGALEAKIQRENPFKSSVENEQNNVVDLAANKDDLTLERKRAALRKQHQNKEESKQIDKTKGFEH